jgi:hypothetical protein
MKYEIMTSVKAAIGGPNRACAESENNLNCRMRQKLSLLLARTKRAVFRNRRVLLRKTICALIKAEMMCVRAIFQRVLVLTRNPSCIKPMQNVNIGSIT